MKKLNGAIVKPHDEWITFNVKYNNDQPQIITVQCSSSNIVRLTKDVDRDGIYHNMVFVHPSVNGNGADAYLIDDSTYTRLSILKKATEYDEYD